MKRRTLMIVTILLSLMLTAIPVRAAATPRGFAHEVGEPAQIPAAFSSSLEDIINALPDGYHDNFGGTQDQFFCRAEGWAADPDDRSLDLNIRIFSDGVEVAQTVGDTFRQDLADAGVCAGGTCSFSVNLWGLIAPDVEHTITIQSQDAQSLEWANLGNTPKSLSCIGPNWQQLSSNGFGDNQTIGVSSLQVFQNQLYAGTASGSGGSVWRQQPDGQWQQVSEPGFGSGSAATAIIDLAVFQGQLYAGIGWGDAAG
jgi:hypothetical protein